MEKREETQEKSNEFIDTLSYMQNSGESRQIFVAKESYQ
jgi:hypothetical protein